MCVEKKTKSEKGGGREMRRKKRPQIMLKSVISDFRFIFPIFYSAFTDVFAMFSALSGISKCPVTFLGKTNKINE